MSMLRILIMLMLTLIVNVNFNNQIKKIKKIYLRLRVPKKAM